jgi:hypothetical protein
MADEKVSPRNYDKISSRVLNRSIKKRETQIAATESGNPTSKKSLAQLRYELQQMTNALLERSIIRVSETTEIQTEE